MDDILKEFLLESRKDIENFFLTPLEDNKKIIILRTLHNIKGTAGFFNLSDLVSLSHEAESIFKDEKDIEIFKKIVYKIKEEIDFLLTPPPALKSDEPLKNQLDMHIDGFSFDSLENMIFHLHSEHHHLKEALLNIRFEDFEDVCAPFVRLSQALAHSLEKKAHFVAEGDIKIEHSMIVPLIEIVTQLIRNAVVHGIEVPEMRKKKRKEGTIKLSAFYSGMNLILTFSDDGAGIDFDSLRQQSPEASSLTNEELLSSIFVQGTTTKSQASENAGRGMGMDVIKHHLQSLRGIIEVKTEKDKGTSFTMTLPLARRFSLCFSFQSNNTLFACPVEGIVKLEKNEIILQREAEQVKIPVTHPLEMEEVLIKALPTSLQNIKELEGITFLKDGRIAFLLRTTCLFHDENEENRSSFIERA